MPLALKFKFISTERWEPKQNERGQAECKQNKKKLLTIRSQIVET